MNDYYSPPDRTAGSENSAPAQSNADVDTAINSNPMTAEQTNGRAVEDAKRLASKVQSQQRELQAQRERIDELETRLQWYRQALGVQSSQGVSSGDEYDVEGAPGSTTDGYESELRDTQRSSASPHADSVAPSTNAEFGQDSEDESETADVNSESGVESTQQSGFIN